MASTTLARAPSFSRGATESSRSRKTMSAGIPGPLPSIFSLEPGMERQERRGRPRVRADMASAYGGAPARDQGGRMRAMRVSRRRFLTGLGAAGGAGAVLGALAVIDRGDGGSAPFVAPREGDFSLQGRVNDTSVLVLGAGVAG